MLTVVKEHDDDGDDDDDDDDEHARCTMIDALRRRICL